MDWAAWLYSAQVHTYSWGEQDVQVQNMQIIPRPKADYNSFLTLSYPTEPRQIPFRYFIQRFEGMSSEETVAGEELSEICLLLLAQTKSILSMSLEDTVLPRNVILIHDWMILIPRPS